jgi:transcriptional regulator with XRE-family HTH domain
MEVPGGSGAYGLRELRRDRGLSLQAVAVLAGISDMEVSLLERGKIRAPRPQTIVALAKALGISAHRMRDILTAPAAADDQAKPAEAAR